jgi:acylphosphatase
MRKHLDIKVFGRVQGVNFRSAAETKAADLGIAGFIKNEADGSLYLEAEGEEAELRNFVDWCKTGTPWSEVERVEVSEGGTRNFIDFEVVYDDNF